MPIDLVPRRLLSFPSLSPLWDEAEEWLSNATTQHSGLSLSEDDKAVYVEAALPGVDPKNIEVTYQDGYVWIRGEVKDEEKDKQKKFYRRATQSFSYRIAVPSEIDHTQEPEASYDHGMIRITFAKSPKVMPKKLTLKVQEKK